MLILKKQEGYSPGASTIHGPETEQPNHFINSVDAKKADKMPIPNSKNTKPLCTLAQDKDYLLKTRANTRYYILIMLLH